MGQASHTAFAMRERTRPNMTTPTMSASIACRLGIAAYGFAAKAMRPLEWFTDEYCPSVSTKPHSGNIRGGAVGMKTYPRSPTRFAKISQLRKPAKRSWWRKYTHSSVMPTTANCESQYVYDVSVTRIDDVSTTRCTAGSKRAPTWLSLRSTHSPFWNAW